MVTALEFRLFPVAGVYAGAAMFDADRAADAMSVYREWALDEPDESNTARRWWPSSRRRRSSPSRCAASAC